MFIPKSGLYHHLFCIQVDERVSSLFSSSVQACINGACARVFDESDLLYRLINIVLIS